MILSIFILFTIVSATTTLKQASTCTPDDVYVNAKYLISANNKIASVVILNQCAINGTTSYMFKGCDELTVNKIYYETEKCTGEIIKNELYEVGDYMYYNALIPHIGYSYSYDNQCNNRNPLEMTLYEGGCILFEGVSIRYFIEDNKMKLRAYSDKSCKNEMEQDNLQYDFDCNTCFYSSNSGVKYICEQHYDVFTATCSDESSQYKYFIHEQLNVYGVYTYNQCSTVSAVESLKLKHCSNDYYLIERYPNEKCEGNPYTKTYNNIPETSFHSNELPSSVAYSMTFNDESCEYKNEFTPILFSSECGPNLGKYSKFQVIENEVFMVIFDDEKCTITSSLIPPVSLANCDVCDSKQQYYCEPYSKPIVSLVCEDEYKNYKYAISQHNTNYNFIEFNKCVKVSERESFKYIPCNDKQISKQTFVNNDCSGQPRTSQSIEKQANGNNYKYTNTIPSHIAYSITTTDNCKTINEAEKYLITNECYEHENGSTRYSIDGNVLLETTYSDSECSKKNNDGNNVFKIPCDTCLATTKYICSPIKDKNSNTPNDVSSGLLSFILLSIFLLLII